jgi:quinolinate synthase
MGPSPVVGATGEKMTTHLHMIEEKHIDPSLDLEEEIQRLKKERNAVLLAHYYQESEIQDIADFIGDSLQLSQQAASTDADVICFAGVHFMAETAKILSPEKVVVLPDLEAGCSLADGCPADKFKAWIELQKQKLGMVTVISYINCSAEVKALSDYICTSSNAETIVRYVATKYSKERGWGGANILFAPDKNLGAYIMKKTGIPMTLWQGTCIVHETFSERKLVALKMRHPDALLLAHPECDEAILKMADHIASTTGILKYAVSSSAKEFIVATESGILHQMQKAAPDKTFIPAPPEASCACNECPFMKKNTLEKVYLALRDLEPQISMSDDLMDRARISIDRMMALS